jgi:HEPN domain-containing protein
MQRLDEARLILDRLTLYAAAQYLGGYAVECMLKALVISRPTAVERSRSSQDIMRWMKNEFGHDLNKLRKEASRRGAQLPPSEAKEFLFVSTWDPQSRYDPGPGNPTDAERFLAGAEKFVKWADNCMTV